MEDKKCLTELDEVLEHLKAEDKNKIPISILKSIKENKDKNYLWKYDETKELKEQNLDRKTISMLSYISTEYLLTNEQKLFIEKFHKFNEKYKNCLERKCQDQEN